MNNTLIRFHLRGSEDFDAVRIGLCKFMLNLETLHTQYNLGDIELVLAEVLNNIVEHGSEDAQKHPISMRWSNADQLCITIIDSGRCIPSEIITNANMPDLHVGFSNLPEGGFGWALVNAICCKVCPKRRGSFNTLRLYFSKQ